MKTILTIFLLGFCFFAFAQSETDSPAENRNPMGVHTHSLKPYSIIASMNISKLHLYARSERDASVNPALVGFFGQFSFNLSDRWSWGPLGQFSYLKSTRKGSFSKTNREGFEYGVGALVRLMMARADRLNLFFDTYTMYNYESTQQTLINETGTSDSLVDVKSYGTLNISVGMNWVFNPKWSLYASFSPSGMIFKKGVTAFSNDFFVRRLKYFVGVEYSFGNEKKSSKKKKKHSKRKKHRR